MQSALVVGACPIIDLFLQPPDKYRYYFDTGYTPFENAQRWMGKNTFHFLLLNDDNMIGEH